MRLDASRAVGSICVVSRSSRRAISGVAASIDVGDVTTWIVERSRGACVSDTLRLTVWPSATRTACCVTDR